MTDSLTSPLQGRRRRLAVTTPTGARVVEQRQDRHYVSSGDLAPPYPMYVCSACGAELGTAEREYHDAAGEWDYCPWCGVGL